MEVTKPSGTLQYGYDADGIRTSKTEGGTTTNYVVDHNRQYARVLAELEDGVLAKTYTYGDDLVSQQAVGGSDSFYLYDGLGTTRGLTDASGGLSDEYFYEAFGELLASTGSTENDYLFTGEQFDADLEQYYLRARYYDPSVGRFAQMDTWQGRLQEPVTLNKYLYANADPVNGVDPSGYMTLAEQSVVNDSIGINAAFSIGRVGLVAPAANQSVYATGASLSSKQIGLLALAAMGASGAVLLDSLSEKDENEDRDTPVRLSRAVEDIELADLYICNCFNSGRDNFPKQFFHTDGEALKFGYQFIIGKKHLDRFHLVNATISSKLYSALDHEAREPGIGPIVTVPHPLLRVFNIDVMKHGGWQYKGTYD